MPASFLRMGTSPVLSSSLYESQIESYEHQDNSDVRDQPVSQMMLQPMASPQTKWSWQDSKYYRDYCQRTTASWNCRSTSNGHERNRFGIRYVVRQSSFSSQKRHGGCYPLLPAWENGRCLIIKTFSLNAFIETYRIRPELAICLEIGP